MIRITYGEIKIECDTPEEAERALAYMLRPAGLMVLWDASNVDLDLQTPTPEQLKQWCEKNNIPHPPEPPVPNIPEVICGACYQYEMETMEAIHRCPRCGII